MLPVRVRIVGWGQSLPEHVECERKTNHEQ